MNDDKKYLTESTPVQPLSVMFIYNPSTRTPSEYVTWMGISTLNNLQTNNVWQ